MWEEMGNKAKMNTKGKGRASTTCMWAVKNNWRWLSYVPYEILVMCLRERTWGSAGADVCTGCKMAFNLFVARRQRQQIAPWKQQTHTSHAALCQEFNTGQSTSRLHNGHNRNLVGTFSLPPTHSATKEQCFNNTVNHWIMIVFGTENTKCHFSDRCKPSYQQEKILPFSFSVADVMFFHICSFSFYTGLN